MRKPLISIALLFLISVAYSQNRFLDNFVQSVSPLDKAMVKIKARLNRKGVDTVVCYSKKNGDSWAGWGVVLWKKNNKSFAKRVDDEHGNKVVVRTKKRFNPYLVTSFKGKIENAVQKTDKSDSLFILQAVISDEPSGMLICQYGNEMHCFGGVNERFESLKAAFTKHPTMHKQFSYGRIK